MLRSRISGIGAYVPPRVVTNADLEEPIEASGRSIERRTGIRQRYWADDPQVATSDLALEASRAALADAGIGERELDMVVFATLSPDAAAPGSGCFLQKKLGVPGIPTFDLRQQCSGFLYGLSLADLYIRAGHARHVLLVGAELQSKLLDKSPAGRKVTVLFGDGAGAAVVSAAEVEDDSARSRESFVLSTHLHSDGGLLGHLLWRHPGTMNPQFVTPELLDEPASYPQMNGRELYDVSLARMPEVTHEALAANQLGIDDVDLFVIHQSSTRMNRAYAAALGVPSEKIFSTVETYGNTTAATIPIGLWEAVRQGRLKRGMLVASCSFGSGLTWASALYRW